MIITERDKKLLYILGVLLVLSMGFYLLLMPAYDGYSNQLEQLDAANAEFDRRQAVIASVDVTQASISELRQKLVPEFAGYPKVMHNLELDRRHTLRAVMQQCVPTELTMEPMQPLEIAHFDASAAADDDEMVEAVEQPAGGTAWLAASGITMVFNGRQDDVVTLIDTIEKIPSEQVETIKITPMEIEVTLDDKGNPIVTVEEENPYLNVEITTRQFYALNQQTPELELPGVSFQ